MNYFDIFQIPVQLKVNLAELSSKYFEQSRKFHPDFYINAPEEKQQEALEKTALLNNAWKTFRQPDETIRYVLQIKGILTDEEKYQLPADFLMEVMDINESIMDDAGEDDSQLLQKRINELQNEIYEIVRPVIETYNDAEVTEEQLMIVKEYYYKKKYIDRIKKELQAKNHSGYF